MLGWIAYLMGTFIVGLILSFIVSLFAMGPSHRTEKPYRILIACMALSMVGPFAYFEILTMSVGDQLGHAVRQCYNDSEMQGPFSYFRVMRYSDSSATAIAIGSEKQGWGGTDRPILRIELKKEGGTWTADSYTVVYSARLNKDGIIFPPYS